MACLPLCFSTGELHAATFATKGPAGFSDDELARLRQLLRPLARVTEIFALRRTAQNLLDTYVGHHTGARILSGRIMKGDLETLRAVLWFSDLRGFTELSQRLAPAQVIATLNELFDCQVPAIEAQGGEVLKFMGDGLLAIFPFDDEASIGAACKRALVAAQTARAKVSERNERAATAIHFGVALHVGEVAYGNVGGASRLDFTCIGSAVNLAARLEGLTGKLGRVLVISEALAAHIDEPLDELGTFELKGVREAVRVFSPCSTPEGPRSLR
jgi:adenylate cyclase